MLSRFKSLASSRKVKIGAGLVGATALGYGAYKLGKKFLGKKGVKKKTSSIARLKQRAVKKMLKIKNIQLDRKLLKEQLKGV